VVATPVGEAVLGFTAEGIVWLSFGPDTGELAEFWRGGRLVEERRAAQELADRLFVRGGAPEQTLLVEGTPFRLKAWRALLTASFGERITYAQLAERAGCPKGARSVGTAIGRNNISFLIPCHRIVRADGSVGGYRWGAKVKRALLEWELSTAN
jgi:AraC family transcriptional regulator of adaptative response/methylated-DNA-[protein]-cysteine methyltransferase